eukprot:2012660-Prymnesium_polylepis.1
MEVEAAEVKATEVEAAKMEAEEVGVSEVVPAAWLMSARTRLGTGALAASVRVEAAPITLCLQHEASTSSLGVSI